MKLLFLGTGAADWRVSDYVKGNFFRRFSCALVNDDLMIDAGPDFFNYAELNECPNLYNNVKNIIITHSHPDHICPSALLGLSKKANFTVWGDVAIKTLLENSLGDEAKNITFKELPLYNYVVIGRYNVKALPSNHLTKNLDEKTRVYLVENKGRTLFYGCDCSWLPTRTWNVLRDTKVDTMIFELTCGLIARDDWRIFEHNTIDMLELMLKSFKKNNYFFNTKIYTSHHAKTLHGSHEELKEYLSKYNVTPAYDGLEIEI